MAAERFGSKTDVIVKLVLVFFIALLSFSIGTFVGKKFSDNQYKLAELEPQEGTAVAHNDEHGEEHGDSRGIASISPDANEVKPNKALSDDEIAKLAEEFVTDDVKEEMPGHMQNPLDHADAEEADDHHGAKPAAKTAHEAPAAADKKAPIAAAPHAVEKEEHGDSHQAQAVSPAAQRLAHGESAVIANKAPAPSRIPSSLPTEIASSALGKYTVQVGAYQSEKEAQTKAAELKEKGFSAFYVSAQVKGSTWYRVSVGLFTTQKEAEAYKKDLISRAKVGSAMVQKVTSAD